MTFPFVLLAAGCGIADKIEGLTNPLVAEALVLGIEEPSTKELDPGAAGLEPGVGATVFLADAKNVDDIEEAPVAGADVAYTDTSGSFAMEEDDGGEYRVTSVDEQDFEYVPDGQADIRATIDGKEHAVIVQKPGAVELDVPLQHTAGEPLTLDASGEDIDNLLVVVFRADTGEVVFSNRPQSVRDYYDLGHSTGEVTVTIDGDALSAQTLYGVGAAGLVNGEESEFESVNTVLSAIMAGEMRFYPVTTL
jgi:hypothetical protein